MCVCVHEGECVYVLVWVSLDVQTSTAPVVAKKNPPLIGKKLLG